MRCQPDPFNDRQYGGLIIVEHRQGILKAKSVDGFQLNPLEDWVGQNLLGFLRRHVCVGAKALAGLSEEHRGEDRPPHEGLHYAVYPDMTTVASAIMFLTDLEGYYERSDQIHDLMKSFVSIFPNEPITSQDDFATKYWRFAQILSDLSMLTHKWDEAVGNNPAEPNFELSLAGRAVFTTTLNPQSPRVARKFSYPAWVMNQTRQFELLRAQGHFENWKAAIRKADMAVDPSGKPNPILQDHGYGSSAMQLAGSTIDPCPLEVRRTPDEIVAAGSALLSRAKEEHTPDSILDELKRRIQRASRSNQT